MKNDTCIVVRANDTDVLIILLSHALRFGEHLHIWMDVGLCSNNTRRYINVTQLAEHLGNEFCSTLSTVVWKNASRTQPEQFSPQNNAGSYEVSWFDDDDDDDYDSSDN